MNRSGHFEVLPRTRSGALGATLSAIAIAVGVIVIATDSPGRGRNVWAYTWALVVLAGATELFAILRRGERSLVAYVALMPFALLIVLLVMEFTGLME